MVLFYCSLVDFLNVNAECTHPKSRRLLLCVGNLQLNSQSKVGGNLKIQVLTRDLL